MRQVELAPAAVVKLGGRSAVAVAGFGEVGEVAGAVVEVLLGVGGVPKSKAPTKVHEQMLTPSWLLTRGQKGKEIPSQR